MTEPIHTFRMESYADLGVFAEPPYLRAKYETGAGWKSMRDGDLVVQCLALEFAAVVGGRRECIEAMEEQLAAAEERIATLELALDSYGQHAPTCPVWQYKSESVPRCICGLAAALGGPDGK